jgi:hypothetical protein
MHQSGVLVSDILSKGDASSERKDREGEESSLRRRKSSDARTDTPGASVYYGSLAPMFEPEKK